ncbi:MAG TPA: D-tagatose-bisphosphate aldolase, class II, non-catalytic subunit [Burkholderiaceae bacterium]|nr:D-tagatose-bisphosphate aldolase, class II, non-catalytic subunit [Burkholderiaceae bacterium]
MTSALLGLASRRRAGQRSGIYSVCSAHPLVIEAAMQQVLEDGTSLLVEATSNQVDQFGGYTGMRPADFITFVQEIAARVGLDAQRVLFGGDHLGPNPWRDRPAEEAMSLAKELLATYAAAGFAKLHLDASMRCADDPPALDDRVVAERAASLCAAAESAARGTRPVYVIGTEVPVPGGAAESLAHVEVTAPESAQRTIDVHEEAFSSAGLHDAWTRVVALVVQPGVEFDHGQVVDYHPTAARTLSSVLDENTGLVFEAHSTDYQRPDSLAALVRDGFAILKVGPGLTFALREALYALAAVEAELVDDDKQSRLREVVERVMLDRPESWERYYHGDLRQQRLLRVFSYSDRIRYYWPDPVIVDAAQKLIENLASVDIPENVLSQYLPQQYLAVREGRLSLEPKALALDRVRDALRPYAAACRA